MKSKTVVAVLALVYLTVLIGGGALANPGGVGDSNEEYDCGTSCHSTQGTGTISGSASSLTPTTGQSITVTITVTSGQVGSGDKVGVFLVRQLQISNSQPSVDGWQILSDPNGGAHNYVEKTAAAASTPIAFTWGLKAPSAPGTYHLYARAHHGGGGEQYLDFTAGLSFTVSVAGAGMPVIQHQPPQNVRPGNQILVSATMINTTSAVMKWKNSGMASPTSVTMTNTSTASGSGWLYQAVIPAQSTATVVTYDITAYNGALNTTSSFSITVSEGGGQQGITWDQQVLWAITVVSVMVVIAGATILISILFKRKLRKSD